MSSSRNELIIIFLIIGAFGYSTAYKWVPMNSSNPIPVGAVRLFVQPEVYVGRAKHFGEVLPVEISKNGQATLSNCASKVTKHQFEILTAEEHCEFEQTDFSFYGIGNVPENIVRGGTARNGEPIFIGRSRFIKHIASVYLTTNRVDKWNCNYNLDAISVLVCEDNNTWIDIDSSTSSLPINTISGGKSQDGSEIFVARLNTCCEIIPGQVIKPHLGNATAVYNGRIISSDAYQVLVGNPEDYAWEPASAGKIPDYAVVAGKYWNQLAYVARVHQRIRYVIYPEALTLNYDILVKKK